MIATKQKEINNLSLYDDTQLQDMVENHSCDYWTTGNCACFGWKEELAWREHERKQTIVADGVN